jgi:hypothetical protein
MFLLFKEKKNGGEDAGIYFFLFLGMTDIACIFA